MLDNAAVCDRPSSQIPAASVEINRDDNARLRTQTRSSNSDTTVQKVIDGAHPFTLVDAAAAKNGSSETHDAASSSHQVAGTGDTDDRNTKRDWTVAVNLTTDLGTSICTVDSQMKELAAMADKTKNQPGVRVIAQGIFPKRVGDTAVLTNRGEDQKTRADNFELRRFEIADGKVRELPTTQAHGLAKDSQDLVALASQYSADHIALMQQAHGLGNIGQNGAVDGASLKEITDSIQKGLDSPGSKFKQLDVLDFDSCMMAEKGVGNMTQHVAKYLVASEETEGNVDDTANGQSRERMLTDLVANPKMDGRDLGNALVKAARDGADNYPTPRGAESGVQTLTNFDGSQSNQYNKSLDRVAADLIERMSDPEQRKLVESSVQDAQRLGTKLDPDEKEELEKRDVHSFVKNIEALVKSGKLTDPDGSLQENISTYYDAEKKFVVSNYGEKGGYETTGGVTAYLPADQNLDLQKRAEDQTLLKKIDQIVSGSNKPGEPAPIMDQKSTTADLTQIAAYTRQVLADTPSASAPLKQLDQAIEQYSAAKTTAELETASIKVKAAENSISADQPSAQKLQALAARSVQNEHNLIEEGELSVETKVWQDLVHRLSATRPGSH